MKRIDSRVNPLYRSWKSLLASSGIKEEAAVLVSGRKLVPEFLATNDMRLKHLIVSDPKEVEKLVFKSNLDVIWLKKDLFDELDEAGTHFPLLVLDAPPVRRANLSLPPKGLEIVLSFSNPLNLGAALRSAEAFGVAQAVLLKECANPFLPKVTRSSSGSSLRVPITFGPSIKDLSLDETKTMCALDLDGENLNTAQLDQDIRLFIGEEGRGVPADLQFAKKLSIPIKPGMDSLNAVAATSIALYAWKSRL